MPVLHLLNARKIFTIDIMVNLPISYILDSLSSPRPFWFNVAYFIFAIFPCLAWLWFYSRQDKHPEPKWEIFFVFLLGALTTVIAVYIEIFLANDCSQISNTGGGNCVAGIIFQMGLPPLLALIIANVIGIAFIEEFFKYIVVWLKEQAIDNNSLLDEPIDFVVYMIASAMGFAAAENLFYFLQLLSIHDLFYYSLFRGVSAILIHTLCSGILGYYMAMAFCRRDKKISYLAFGIILASLLHGLYNLSIIIINRVQATGLVDDGQAIALLAAAFLLIIVPMALLLYFKIRELKKMKSVCDMRFPKK